MSRIYQANKTSSLNSEVVNRKENSPGCIPNDISEVITPNRVASNVKLFTNNFNTNNADSSSRSSSPRVITPVVTASKRTDSTTSEEINTLKKLTKEVSATLTNIHQTTPAANPTSLLFTDLEIDEMSQETLNNLISRLESVANRLESLQVAQPSTGAATNGKHSAVEVEELHQSINAYDDLLANFLKPFLTTSSEIGGDVKSISDLVDQAFQYERSFLLEASKCVKPADLQAFYGLFSKKIEAVQEVREKNRKSEFFNHLSAISESIGALGWIAVSPAPSPYVKEMNDSAQFYTNRVLKDFKEKDPKHAQWVKQWIQLLNELQAYVKEYHTTGVTWNSTRKAATFNPSLSGSTNGTATKGVAPKAGGPSGPPPPPLPNFTELLAEDPKKTDPKGPTADALFAAINKGTNITSGLKKVSDDMKTHKNPNLRQSAVVPGEVSVRNVSVKTEAPVVRPPLFELDDKKWKIEYMNKRNDLVIDQTEIKQTVYIYKCKECTIQVKGKVNSILVDSCNRVGLVFEDLLSTIEFINCQSVQMQVLGTVPTVVIEKTDGCQVYLSSTSLNTEVISSKSSAMNILIPTADGEFKEQPIPESYKTVISPQDYKLSTCQTDI